MMQEVIPNPFDICVQSGDMAVREALARLLDGLSPLNLDMEESGTVELVLAEALNNIVEHAYAPGTPSGPIKIRCQHKSDGLHLSIEDEGIAMPEGHMPLGVAQDLDVDLMDMPEGGFGWFLIQDLAKDVRYQRIGQANLLNLRLAIGCHS